MIKDFTSEARALDSISSQNWRFWKLTHPRLIASCSKINSKCIYQVYIAAAFDANPQKTTAEFAALAVDFSGRRCNNSLLIHSLCVRTFTCRIANCPPPATFNGWSTRTRARTPSTFLHSGVSFIVLQNQSRSLSVSHNDEASQSEKMNFNLDQWPHLDLRMCLGNAKRLISLDYNIALILHEIASWRPQSPVLAQIAQASNFTTRKYSKRFAALFHNVNFNAKQNRHTCKIQFCYHWN